MYGIPIIHILVLVGIWLLPALFAALYLRQAELSDVAKALWGMVIVFIPVLGALFLLLVRPGNTHKE